jgi:hypothetical protein
MNSFDFKKLIPHLIAYFTFIVVTFILFMPAVFEGKVLKQGDTDRARAMQTEIKAYKNETGKGPLWTNSQFAGMPTYQINQTIKGNFTKPIYRASLLGQKTTDAHFVILLAMACCYILLIVLQVDWRISLFGALVYGISSYHIDLAEAGHITKLVTFAFLPLLYAGPILAFRGRYLLGSGLFALATALHIYANHIQITYYAFIMLAIMGIVELVKAIKNKELPAFAKTAGLLIFAAAIGVMSNTSKLWPSYEYAQESQRGKSELSAKAGQDGLSKDYIWGWSYGIKETMTLLVPQFMGGGASQRHEGRKTYDVVYNNFIQQGYPRADAIKTANQQTGAILYWGDQPFVGMGIYFGAVVWFLFILGAFLAKGSLKWWLIISTVLAIMFAWGGNFFLNDILVDYFPLFNKFRAVSMALGLAQLSAVILGLLGLQRLVDQSVDIKDKRKALMIAAGSTAGLCILAMLASYGMDMTGKNDSNFGQIIGMVKEDRGAMIREDALRSLLFILAAAGLTWAYINSKLKGVWTVVAIGALMVIDMWSFDTRYLYADKFETPREIASVAEPRPVDTQIKSDTDPHYRVLDLAGGFPFSNVNTSFHHKSIGGYHSAKLMVFQEFIDAYPPNGENMDLYGMLNAKYIIQGQNGNANANRNPDALGNAWFVSNYNIVENADAELAALQSLNPRNQAVIQDQYADQVKGQTFTTDSTAVIRLTEYNPDRLVYEYSANSPQLTLFSEVYYPADKGWKLLVDGTETDPIFKANYLLRAAVLPAGQHKIEMVFKPRSFYLGENISRVASILTLLMFIGGIFIFVRDRGLPEVQHIDELPEKKPGAKAKPTKSKKGKKK